MGHPAQFVLKPSRYLLASVMTQTKIKYFGKNYMKDGMKICGFWNAVFKGIQFIIVLCVACGNAYEQMPKQVPNKCNTAAAQWHSVPVDPHAEQWLRTLHKHDLLLNSVSARVWAPDETVCCHSQGCDQWCHNVSVSAGEVPHRLSGETSGDTPKALSHTYTHTHTHTHNPQTRTET